MNKNIYAGVTAFALMISGVLCGCEQSNTEDVKESGHLSSVKSDNDPVAEIIPNDASDFKWHEITADENPYEVGYIMITGYVGERTDVVIPKSIQDKPVVAIGDFAFSPLSEEDIIMVVAKGEGWKEPEIHLNLLEISGLTKKYDEIYHKILEMDEGCLELIQAMSGYERNGNDSIGFVSNFENIDPDNLKGYSQKNLFSICDENKVLIDDALSLFQQYEMDDIFTACNLYCIDDDEITYCSNSREYMRFISIEKISEALSANNSISDLKQVLIPNSISYIGGCSFAFCGNLETVKMYDISEDELPLIQVDAISGSDFESYPFYACNNLKETNFYLNVDEVCGTDSCYNYCIDLEKIYLYPNSHSVEFGGWGLDTLKNLNSIVIKDGCTCINNGFSYKHKTFAGCTFYIPASVTEIDDHIFCTHFNNGEYDTEGSPDVDDCKICDDIMIVTPSGSYAESYAKANNIPYRNE